MVRTAGGKLIPAQHGFGPPVAAKRFLLILQYWAGDKEATEELAELIADLERIRNRDVDVLIFGRYDAPVFSQLARGKLEAKFNKVMFERCRRRDAIGYPWGANAMFSDLVMLMAQYSPYKDDYFAFINLESDCCPLHPGWIGEMIQSFQVAESEGKSLSGYLCNDPWDHFNGVAVYAIDIYKRVGSGKLSGCPPQAGYDTYHANTLMPFGSATPFIRMNFQRPTITAEDLFFPHLGIEPAIHHGVKDASAREAVRAKYITHSDPANVTAKTVFTFYIQTPNTSKDDDARKLEVWRTGWRSRGWNPVVLTQRDATRNNKFTAMQANAERLPTTKERQAANYRFLRWLALESMGGGFMVDADVLPGQFTPTDLVRREGGVVLTASDHGSISAMVVSKDHLTRFIEAVIAYDVRPEDLSGGNPDINDFTVWRSMEGAEFDPVVVAVGENDYRKAKLVQFNSRAVAELNRGEKQAVAMERYLRGN